MQKVALRHITLPSESLELRERSQTLKDTSIRLRKASSRLRRERSYETLGPETEAFHDALRLLDIVGGCKKIPLLTEGIHAELRQMKTAQRKRRSGGVPPQFPPETGGLKRAVTRSQHHCLLTAVMPVTPDWRKSPYRSLTLEEA